MSYQVTIKETSASPALLTPGEHYIVEDPGEGIRWFRKIQFFRTKDGREIATDDLGTPLLADGDLFRQVRAAVEAYDADHPPH